MGVELCFTHPRKTEFCFWVNVMHTCRTRMHSSRMRTVHCSSHLLGGCLSRGRVSAGGLCPGGWGCLPRGWGCLPGEGVCLGRVSARVSAGGCLPEEGACQGVFLGSVSAGVSRRGLSACEVSVRGCLPHVYPPPVNRMTDRQV